MDHDENDPLYEAKMYDDFIDGKIQMTPYRELERREMAPPPIEGLSDEDVTRELTNLIWGLADLSIYIDSVGHLSDRELYAMLLDFCDEPNMFFPGSKNTRTWWSPIGSGTEVDLQAYLRHYATEETRQQFKSDYNMVLPGREPIPYPRPWMPAEATGGILDHERTDG
jgi:hypothetical protein